MHRESYASHRSERIFAVLVSWRSRLARRARRHDRCVATAYRHAARRKQNTTSNRLDGIDAPERTQPHGQRAGNRWPRWPMSTRARGLSKVDRYGRAVCRVVIDGVDVGLEQIGAASMALLKYAHSSARPNAQVRPRRKRCAFGERWAVVVQ